MPNEPGFNQTEWLRLCAFVHKELLGYPPEAKFPRSMALRLRGLARGQHMANNRAMVSNGAGQGAAYGFDILYHTCVLQRATIQDYLSRNQQRIKDEGHLVNTIMLFLEQAVNGVYLKARENQAKQQRIETLSTATPEGGAGYTAKSTRPADDLEALW